MKRVDCSRGGQGQHRCLAVSRVPALKFCLALQCVTTPSTVHGADSPPLAVDPLHCSPGPV